MNSTPIGMWATIRSMPSIRAGCRTTLLHLPRLQAMYGPVSGAPQEGAASEIGDVALAAARSLNWSSNGANTEAANWLSQQASAAGAPAAIPVSEEQIAAFALKPVLTVKPYPNQLYFTSGRELYTLPKDKAALLAMSPKSARKQSAEIQSRADEWGAILLAMMRANTNKPLSSRKVAKASSEHSSNRPRQRSRLVKRGIVFRADVTGTADAAASFFEATYNSTVTPLENALFRPFHVHVNPIHVGRPSNVLPKPLYRNYKEFHEGGGVGQLTFRAEAFVLSVAAGVKLLPAIGNGLSASRLVDNDRRWGGRGNRRRRHDSRSGVTVSGKAIATGAATGLPLLVGNFGPLYDWFTDTSYFSSGNANRPNPTGNAPKQSTVAPHGETPSPRGGNESHHGIMSRWMEENFSNYNPDKAPAVLMDLENITLQEPFTILGGQDEAENGRNF